MAFASKVRTSSICLKRGTIPAAEGASGGSSDTRVPSGPRYWRYSISKVAATLMNSLAWSSTGAGHDNRWAFPVRCALRQGPGPAPQEKGGAACAAPPGAIRPVRSAGGRDHPGRRVVARRRVVGGRRGGRGHGERRRHHPAGGVDHDLEEGLGAVGQRRVGGAGRGEQVL